MPLAIQQRNHVRIAIEATTAAIESSPIELVSERDYTILCSPLGLGEMVYVMVYDYTTDSFNQMRVGGNDVHMIPTYEVLTFSKVSCVIKLYKTATASAVGVSVVSR